MIHSVLSINLFNSERISILFKIIIIPIVYMQGVTIRNIVIGGGGTMIYTYLGAVQELVSSGLDLKGIKNYIGSSAGGLSVAMLACGATPELVHQMEIIKNPSVLADLKDPSNFIVKAMLDVVTNFGYNKGEALTKLVHDIIEELTGDGDITFSKHYKRYRKNLVIISTNITKNRPVYFNRLTHPHMRIIDAVRASCAVPLYFMPYTDVDENGVPNLYVDGSLTHNYPFTFVYTDLFKVLNKDDPEVLGPNYADIVIDEETAIENLYNYNTVPSDPDSTIVERIVPSTLGIKTVSSKSYNYITNTTPDKTHTYNIGTYMYAIVDLMFNTQMKEHINGDIWNQTIPINVDKYSMLDFKFSKRDVKKLIKLGENSVSMYLKTSGLIFKQDTYFHKERKEKKHNKHRCRHRSK